MKIRKSAMRVLALCMLLTLCIPDFKASANENHLLQRADSAYSHGDYDIAVGLYDKVIRTNGATPSLLFNLANCYYKNGNEGMARLMLERAKRLDPSSLRINRNINYLQSRIEDANKAEMKGKKGSVVPDNPGFFGKLYKKIAVDTSSNFWAELGVAAFLLLIAAVAIYLFSTNVKLRKAGFFSAFVFLFATILFVVFAEMSAETYESHDEAVMTTFKTTLLAEPQDDAKTVGYPLHRGTKFEILDRELNEEGKVTWYKVRLNSHFEGWVSEAAITII